MNIDDFSIEELQHIAPADLGSRKPLGPDPRAGKVPTVAQIITGDNMIAAPRADSAPDTTDVDARYAAAVNAEAERQRREPFHQAAPLYINLLILAAVIGAGVAVWTLCKRPLRQMRMGLHLTRMTNIFEDIERTRRTMPIGAGGGVDSLPPSRQKQAEAIFESGLAFLKAFPRHEVTAALVKNAALAESMGRQARAEAILRLMEALVRNDAAMEIDDFKKSYA